MSDLPMQLPTELPLILAGPMLRHTTPESVTVWVALKAACRVTLQIFDTQASGHQIGRSLFAGSRETIALGAHLHIVAVTATAQQGTELTAVGGKPALLENGIYAYDLTFSQLDRVEADRSSPQIVSMVNMPNLNISYFEHRYPTFVLPPNQLADLRIVHGSCRKPHGAGLDALTILDRLLATTADRPSERPQQLLFTGDQIYGDDITDPLLWAVSNLSDRLLGWTEKLPIANPPAPGTFGNRAEIATQQAGLTGGLRHRPQKVSNHLFSFGEYTATYLLTWSPACWTQIFPSGRSLIKDRQAAKKWDLQVQQLKQFIAGLADVRRALANIPLYTIFDDHEVSDDWNLNQAWCLRVLGRPLGIQVVQNALLAYTIFQAWGNTPDRFKPDTAGGKLLAAAQTRSASGGRDLAANLEIGRLLGMSQIEPLTGLPKFVKDGEVSILDRDPEAVSWHYTIESNCHQIIVLDTRTWRGYHLDRAVIEPPMLLSPTAFDRQLIQPLQAPHPSDAPRQTFIVAPTNLFSLPVIDLIHYLSLKYHTANSQRYERIFAADVGDAWNIHTPALARLLTILLTHRDRIVVLSGDIHYGAAAQLSYRQMSKNLSSVLVQLTASAFRNEEMKTKLLHTRLKDWLFPAKIRHSIGWNSPPQMLPFRARQPRSQLQSPHDWECTLRSIERQRAQLTTGNRADLIVENVRVNNFLQPLMWWKSGWFQDNREIVGINNLAVVTCQSESIVQDLYWYFPQHPNRLVYSRFIAPFDPGIK
ncbi:PhoD-like phosphatase [Chamaesiphon sp. VAR_48_metabat_403]|uniref:PhoD-like phosphatase n=1 Tax=Chamaesiphon sp. VAR_48_metabat_403 TaxID=2964700 RepID=UPI00286D939E|nr:PhoD-like phosphatase [Chamaesiphon sp. VAR_48_metabat_403]